MKRKLSKLLGIGLTVALLISLLATAVPALAVSQPTVTLNNGTISAPNAEYTILFTVNNQLSGNATVQDTITIEFPAGTVVAAGITGTIAAGPGWVDSGAGLSYASVPPVLGANFTGTPTSRFVTFTMPNTGVYIGQGAQVLITITAGVTNPANSGTYTLAVRTSKETTAVTSTSYAINQPILVALPGVATAYNSAGIAMAQGTTIAGVINSAGADGKVTLTAGTYNEPPTITIAANKVTIEAAAGAIIPATTDILITGDEVTLTGLTFKSSAAATTRLTINGDKVKIDNCTFEEVKNNSAIVVNGLEAVISNNTIAVGAKAGIASAGTSQITSNNMTVTAGGLAVGVSGNTTIKTNTITGSSGKGINVTGGTVSIENNTFKTLDTAIETSVAITVKGNTFDAIGNASAAPVIKQTNVAGNSTYNNNIFQNINAASYVFDITGGGIVNANFNNFLNNTLNVKANAGTQNFKLNWWGSAAGAATTSIAATAPGTIVVTSPLGAAPTTGKSATTTTATLAAETTAGVDVSFSAAPTIAAASKLAGNPVITAPPIRGTGSVLGYWDIYVDGFAAGTTATIKIYDPGINEYAVVYYGGGLSGLWTRASDQGVNVPGKYVWFRVSNTSVPSNTDFTGTPFAVVIDKTLAAPNIAAGSGATPAIGSYDVSTTPTFTWGPVAGVHHYEIALCEDPTFTIIEWAYNVNEPFFKATDALRYGTTYYWRVRGVLDAASTAFTPWATGIFTTEGEPVEESGTPVIVDPVKPEITVEIPPTRITVEPAAPAIPTYLLWIIVVVGAVLVIALIVLIVRTRRVA